jgi:membrane protein implicated in regulation of membrane protease activity
MNDHDAHDEDRAFSYMIGGGMAAATLTLPALVIPWPWAGVFYVVLAGAAGGLAWHALTRREPLPPIGGEGEGHQ